MKRPHVLLGKSISKRRRSLGHKAEFFAEMAGIGITTLRDIERGVSEGHLSTREAIAQALGCSVADLYQDPEKTNPHPKLSDLSAGEAKIIELLERQAAKAITKEDSPPSPIELDNKRLKEELAKCHARLTTFPEKFWEEIERAPQWLRLALILFVTQDESLIPKVDQAFLDHVRPIANLLRRSDPKKA